MTMHGDIGDALALATVAHYGQKYGDRPYIEHPVAVAQLLLREYGLFPHLIVPALLHDVVEDTPVGYWDVVTLFGVDVADTVDAVTRHRPETYMELIARAAAHPDGRLVKLADNTHNLSGLPDGDPRVGRYIRARKVLIEANGGKEPNAWAVLVSKHIPLH